MAAPRHPPSPWFPRPAKPRQPMIISCGWASPDTYYLSRHRHELESVRLPFTGTMVTVYNHDEPSRKPGGSMNAANPYQGSLSWRVFDCRMEMTSRMFESPLQELIAFQQSRPVSLLDNFLFVTTVSHNRPTGTNDGQPGVFDWWGRYEPGWWDKVLTNIRHFARLARQGGMKGIMIDPEGAGANNWGMWTWQDQTSVPNSLFDKPAYEGHPYDDFGKTAEIVYKRGKEFMQAITSEFSDCAVFLVAGTV